MKSIHPLLKCLLVLVAFSNFAHAFYDPGQGRWLSRDPMEEEGGVNLYVFVANDPVARWDYLGMVQDASNIKEGDPCPKCCVSCRSEGQLRIKDNGTQGSTIKAIAYGRTLTSKCEHTDSCEADCCAATWYWWECYGKKCVGKPGAKYEETIKPIQPPDRGPSEGGVRALVLSINIQKVCRCEKGTWKCSNAHAATNHLTYVFVAPNDASKGWKIGKSF